MATQINPRWLSSTVCDLARVIYDERAFERLPILADALLDAGCDDEELIKGLQTKRAASSELAAILGMSADAIRERYLSAVCSTPVDQIVNRLRAENGRRRERTLTLSDVVECVVDAIKDADGWQAVGGGTVANAYGYRSYQTVCLAVKRTDGKVRVGISAQSGSKGASLTTPFGMTKKSKPEAFRAWADSEGK